MGVNRFLALAAITLAVLACSVQTVHGQSVPTVKGASFDRFFVIMFENKGFIHTMLNKYWSTLSKRGLLLTRWYAVSHPSQPNYVAQIGGSVFNVTDDKNYEIPESNLVDLLESKGVTWKAYQEAYVPAPGGNCNGSASQGTYRRKHNPFMSFNNIRNSPKRCRNIVNADQLDIDLENDALPQFSYFTPDMNNDGHDTDLNYCGKYVTKFVDKYLANPRFIENTLFMITFDEDDYLESNHIYTLLLGPYVQPGTEDSKYTHYSMTRSIEENWGLGSLGRHDVKAPSFMHLFK